MKAWPEDKSADPTSPEARKRWADWVAAGKPSGPLSHRRHLDPDNPADVARLARAIEKSRQTGAWSPYAIARAYAEDVIEPSDLRRFTTVEHDDSEKPVVSNNFWRGCLIGGLISMVFWAVLVVVILRVAS